MIRLEYHNLVVVTEDVDRTVNKLDITYLPFNGKAQLYGLVRVLALPIVDEAVAVRSIVHAHFRLYFVEVAPE